VSCSPCLALCDPNSDEVLFCRLITFIGHSGGAQLVSRYAIIGKDAPSGVNVRFVVSNPSSQLYFTKDRPVTVDTDSCSSYNKYRYSLHDYTPGAAYPLPLGGSHVALFKRWAERDLRYIIGAEDTESQGDQSCMAHATGGVERTRRNQAYWKYINLLGDDRKNADVSDFFGRFATLDGRPRKSSKTARASDDEEDDARRGGRTHSRSTKKYAELFKGTFVNHRFALVDGVGHSYKKIYNSEIGARFLLKARSDLKNSAAPA